MWWLLKWLVYGHLHDWEFEDREVTKVRNGQTDELLYVSVTIYERCRCGATRARKVR